MEIQTANAPINKKEPLNLEQKNAFIIALDILTKGGYMGSGQDLKNLIDDLKNYVDVPFTKISDGNKGERALDDNYIYECVNKNRWVRYPIDQVFNSIYEKKGIAYTNNKEDFSNKISQLRVHWNYSFGSFYRKEVPDNVNFVPMIFGKNGITQNSQNTGEEDEVLNYLIQLKDENKINTLLGFNEPDNVLQANMTVQEAVELWPVLEATGLRLGSPATVNPLNSWMTEFMQEVSINNLKIDFICIHHYAGINVATLIDKIESTYQLYNKPIWITELAVADFTATTPEDNQYTEEQVINFMLEVFEAVKEMDYVEKICWFDGEGRPHLHTSALYNNGQLTNLGEAYRDLDNNIKVGSGEPILTDIELFDNGGFEDADYTMFGGFNNVIGVTNEKYSGDFSVRLINHEASIFQNITLHPNIYIISFYYKWAEFANDNIARLLVRDNATNSNIKVGEDMVNVPDAWMYYEEEISITDVMSLKISIYKASGYALYVDSISVKVKEQSK